MAYWLLKTEPSAYSYLDLEREGRCVWDGVKNALALKHLKEFRKGDETFVYHTGTEKAVVGTARVLEDAHPDSRSGHEPLPVVELAANTRLKSAVPLSAIKSDPAFRDFPLVRLPRLSVVPVTEQEWRKILRMSECD